jgi:HPt (histidine-containing phosphotransfer) domain-containing protein
MCTVSEVFDKMEDMGAEPREVVRRLGGSEDLYIRFLKEFVKEKEMGDLRQAIKTHDAKAAFVAVHTLKGVSLNLGLLPFADHCCDMVEEYRKGNEKEGDALLPDMEQSFKEMCDLIAMFD